MTNASATDFFRQANQSPQWFHGSGAQFDSFDLGKNKTVQDEDDGKHWNSHLGAHFTSDHKVAQEFAQRQGGGHVYHAHLDLKNPKHYNSEYDLDEHAVHWALDKGYDLGPSMTNPAYRKNTEPDEWGLHITHDDNWDHRPEAREIAHGFRDHLKAQGHDGITYGNEFEGAHNGFHGERGHQCAVAFHPNQIQITHSHPGTAPCSPAHEEDDHAQRTAGRGKPRHQPRPDADPAGPGEDAAGGAREVGEGEGGPEAGVAARKVSFHPAAHKELSKLDGASRKRVAATIDSLAAGEEGLQTHALNGALKGWQATKATRGHRVIHRDLDDGTLHVGYVGLHEYETAQRRLAVVDFFRQAANGELPPGHLQRGLNVTLAPDKHRFIHDERQPLPARAHMLLSELKKPTSAIDNEELHGSHGGLGELWTRNHEVADDAALYQHEQRPHDQKSTTVTLHAHEPDGKHFWREMAGGDDYQGNWRVPLHPGTPLGIHAITWGEPSGARHHYDFSHTVDKHAATSATSRFRQLLQTEAAAVDHSDGIMVALLPPADVADELAHEGGQPPEDLHITLAYLGNTSDYSERQLAVLPQLVSAWAVRQKPVSMRTGGVGKFANPHKGQHVLYAAIDVYGGAQLHSNLASYLEGHGYRLPSEHGWTPHMTLRYVDQHFRFMPHVPERRWTANAIYTYVGSTRHEARLGTLPSGTTTP
ncbi:ADP-ribosyltransferase-containing protein [Streptomyces yangpuensis]